MRVLKSFTQKIPWIASLLFILLFVYAAVSKLLDFETFEVQLGQSPLLSVFAGWIAPCILVLELFMALLLLFHQSRYLGLLGSFILMMMFTAYIYLILHFSSFIPCSCGGVLENMTWNQHLVFNAFFVSLAIISLFILRPVKLTFVYLILGCLFSFMILYALFLKSENTLKYGNPFIRRFSDFVEKDNQIDLKYNSFYFAGGLSHKLYFGNYMAPLLLTEVDTALQSAKSFYIKLENSDIRFKSVKVSADSTNFYLYDGSVPCLFKGKLEEQTLNFIGMGSAVFSDGVICDSTSLFIRSHDQNGENHIGITNFKNPATTFFNSTLLEKQIDGNFDTDGILLYDDYYKRGLYVYRYRNQYITFDHGLKNVVRGRTIDTISQAKLKVVYNPDMREKKLAEPPLIVNHNSAAYKGLLFVQSGLVGRFEDRKMWQQASVIDVYNYRNQSYLSSFYVYNIDQKKVSRFFVRNDHFYAFIGKKLVRYALTDLITSEFLEKNIQ